MDPVMTFASRWTSPLFLLRIGTLLTLGCLCLHPEAAAQSGVVDGRVVGEDGQPIAEINVRLNGTAYGAATDADGRYRIDGVPAGQYTLVASGVGYATVSESVQVEEGGEHTVDITLHQTTDQLREIVVEDVGTNYQADSISNSLRLQGTILNAPQNIQVITDDLIQTQLIFNMVEGVARNVSGVHREEHWDNMYARIYTRGSEIPAFRNGMNVSMPWGPLAEDMSMVKRIEFVKGPAGFMMANGQPAGFYNVVTEKPTGRTRGSASLTVGSFNTMRATADFEGTVGDEKSLQYRLNVMGQQEDSHRQFGYNDRYAIAPVLRYWFNDRTSLTAEYTYQYSEFHQPGGYVASPDGYGTLPRDFTVSDPKIGPTRVNDHNLFVTLDHQLNTDWEVTAKLAFFDYSVLGEYVYPGAVDEQMNLARDVSVWDAQSNNKLGQLFVSGSLQTGSVTHDVLAGVDVGDKQYKAIFGTVGDIPDLNLENPQYNIPPDSVPEYTPEKSLNNRATWRDNLSHRAVYVQDEIGFWNDRVRLTLAGRFTDSKTNDIEEQVFTPRAGISVSIDDNTSVYSLYDQAYVPQAGENFQGVPFDPVRGHNLEAGLKRQWFGGQWSSTVAAYRITKDNVLTTDPDHPDFSIQLGQTQTQGVEVDLKGRLLPGLNLVLNYAYTDSEITEDTDESAVGNPTPGAINHLHNSWLSYRVQDGVLEGVGVSFGYSWKVGRTSWYNPGDKLPNFFKMDTGVSWQNDRLSLSLDVNNILDEYLYSGFPSGENYVWITQPPRNFRLRMAYSF